MVSLQWNYRREYEPLYDVEKLDFTSPTPTIVSPSPSLPPSQSEQEQFRINQTTRNNEGDSPCSSWSITIANFFQDLLYPLSWIIVIIVIATSLWFMQKALFTPTSEHLNNAAEM